ncbi:MAG: hypothetical protein ACOY4Q_00050 [Bacillota bacterium]
MAVHNKKVGIMIRIAEGKIYKITVSNKANGRIRELIHRVAENGAVPGVSVDKFWENIRSYTIYRLRWKMADVEYMIAEYTEEVKEPKKKLKKKPKKRNAKKRLRDTMYNDPDLWWESSGTGPL